MRRNSFVPLLVILTIAVGSLAGTLLAGWSPQLGLDLQGGASVVLRPRTTTSSGSLKQAIEIIRNRVDGLGVAEPDIHAEGQNIIVQLPGVKDQKRALSIVGQTAELRFRPVLQALPAEDKTPATTTTTPGSSTSTPPTTAPASIPTTSRDDDKADQTVVLPLKKAKDSSGARYMLGPTELTGKAVKSARPSFDQSTNGWVVDFTLTGDGSKGFDAMAAKNLQKQVAIVLDSVVQSAPTIQQAQFNGRGQISGSFTEREAKDLALVLRYGSLPVELKPETVQTVSASLGKDSLKAGIVAGLLGLGLVLIYMIFYYRALGIVVVMGLAVSATLLWAIISFLGEKSGLALSLAGAVGIIVSVGITVDSYVVYFERLKDEIRSGKTIRSSVDRGFSRAYRTIVAADVASLIGASLLYILTVGSVRGFAFFLGLSTVLDMVVAYFFTRPMVVMLGRNRLFTEARWLGVARGLAATPTGAAS
ncbi:MAG TPA: protein translocase subunit SecD [Acidimicrobiales bacterium]|nr:protein translocase subunit SecD [Acidimicrobiales bacterium]